MSHPRLERFLVAAKGSEIKAQELYKANLLVAESFYPVLHLFEIFLRNTINNKLADHFKNEDWILREKSGFMNDRHLRPSKFFLYNQILSAEKRIVKRGGTVTSGKVVAEQVLGFWTSLFEPHHYKLLRGTIIQCFPNKPQNIQRRYGLLWTESGNSEIEFITTNLSALNQIISISRRLNKSGKISLTYSPG